MTAAKKQIDSDRNSSRPQAQLACRRDVFYALWQESFGAMGGLLTANIALIALSTTLAADRLINNSVTYIVLVIALPSHDPVPSDSRAPRSNIFIPPHHTRPQLDLLRLGELRTVTIESSPTKLTCRLVCGGIRPDLASGRRTWVGRVTGPAPGARSHDRVGRSDPQVTPSIGCCDRAGNPRFA
jgi:hypothetical protein